LRIRGKFPLNWAKIKSFMSVVFLQ
jgi:hypothetical protein